MSHPVIGESKISILDISRRPHQIKTSNLVQKRRERNLTLNFLSVKASTPGTISQKSTFNSNTTVTRDERGPSRRNINQASFFSTREEEKVA